MSRTIRDATFDVFRRRGLTTLFANPGSTEVPFLAGLPDDLRFVLAPAAAVCRELAQRVPARDAEPPQQFRPPAAPEPPGPGEPLTASHVLAALAARLPRDAVVVEEAPVDRPEVHERLLAREPLGVLFVILSNGGYAIMDRLAERHGDDGPWPGFGDVEISALARGFGCPARRVSTYDELVEALDAVIPTLASREEPLLLLVGAIAPTTTFAP